MTHPDLYTGAILLRHRTPKMGGCPSGFPSKPHRGVPSKKKTPHPYDHVWTVHPRVGGWSKPKSEFWSRPDVVPSSFWADSSCKVVGHIFSHCASRGSHPFPFAIKRRTCWKGQCCGWMKSTSHHFATIGSHCLLVFTVESSFQGFLVQHLECRNEKWTIPSFTSLCQNRG